MSRSTAASRKLYELAALQGGYFTARQARDAGYEDNVHPYHVRSRNWIREARGVYRLSQFPLPPRPDLMVWQLWSRNRHDEPLGVFSHGTALSLHELSDLMPARLDMTVPPGFRRMAAIPKVLRLHRARVEDRDVQTIDGVRATTPLRTLLDVIAEGTIAPELLVQAVDEAVGRGKIMRQQLEAARVSTRARQKIERILRRVPDDRATPLHNGQITRPTTDGSVNGPVREVLQPLVSSLTRAGSSLSGTNARALADRELHGRLRVEPSSV